VIYSYPKELRLRTRRDFKRMSWHCVKHVGELIVIDMRKNYSAATRLGITVTRKFGDSHKRNRFKRVVREAFRLSYPSLCKGFDLNIRPRRAGIDVTTQQLQNELSRFLLSDKQLKS
jgi:ribonuclease P protein component